MSMTSPLWDLFFCVLVKELKKWIMLRAERQTAASQTGAGAQNSSRPRNHKTPLLFTLPPLLQNKPTVGPPPPILSSCYVPEHRATSSPSKALRCRGPTRHSSELSACVVIARWVYGPVGSRVMRGCRVPEGARALMYGWTHGEWNKTSDEKGVSVLLSHVSTNLCSTSRLSETCNIARLSDLLEPFGGSSPGDSETNAIMVESRSQILTEPHPEAVVSPLAPFSDSPLQPLTRCSGKENHKTNQ